MVSAILVPGSSLEKVAYGKRVQPSNPVLRELLARITAVVAPIFYAYQTLVWTGITLIMGLTWVVRLIDDFEDVQETFMNIVFPSARNFCSSVLEIPQKVLFGSYYPPNYFGTAGRYDM